MQIDQFQSLFRSAVKDSYNYAHVEIESLSFISGRESSEAIKLRGLSTRLLPDDCSKLIESSNLIDKSQFSSIPELISIVEEQKPSLIVTERLLSDDDKHLVYGLSSYIDALTQVVPSPVLLLPQLEIDVMETSLRDCSDVLVNTDHLTGDSHLINWGARFAAPSGALVLSHIENQKAYEYYIDAISKLPEINTEIAKERLQFELLKLPSDFIDDAKAKLNEKLPELTVDGIVEMGGGIESYRALLNRLQNDLLVFNTKVDGQLAMGGNAYALAVEFKEVPLLLL